MTSKKTLWDLRNSFDHLDWYKEGWRMKEWNEEHPDELAEPGGFESFERMSKWDWERADSLDPAHLWAVVEYAAGGSYVGVDPALRDANIQALMEIAEEQIKEGDLQEGEVVKIYGGYSWDGIAIRGSTSNEELFEALKNLEDYPVLDEDLHSHMEIKYESEAWESWAASDFQRALEKMMDEECVALEIPPEKLLELFYKGMERANEYWEHETSGPYVDVDRVAAAIKVTELAPYCEPWDE